MKNFKEIIEECLESELIGTFVLRNGNKIRSFYIQRKSNLLCSYWSQLYGFFSDTGNCYNGNKHYSEYDIINFIPDNMQEQIKIDIPKGKVPVMEQTENGVIITWKEKELTFNKIYNDLVDKDQQVSSTKCCANCASIQFNKKVEVLRKLTNIRNYFGKPSKKNSDSGWVICINGTVYRAIVEQNPHVPVFAEKEHAEQAIKMLGDELKYLFEPW